MRYCCCLLLNLVLLSLSADCQHRYSIVIHEVMVDPSPPAGLPNHEWIELKNVSAQPVSLHNWRIGDAGSTSGALPPFLLQPDSLVILCASSAAASLSSYGKVLAVPSFPSLDNETDILFLRSSSGATIHAIQYDAHWHRNELKKQGGWSLEMIDAANACGGGGNWTSSLHASGGTPGAANSVAASNPDQQPPRLLRSYTTDEQTIRLQFGESLDSLQAVSTAHYTVDGRGIAGVVVIAPLFNEVALKTDTPMDTGTIYRVTATGLSDCANNSNTITDTARTGLPREANPGECRINEILFNPRPTGFDYVECLHTGTGIIDAARLSIANRNASGVISSIRTVSEKPFYLFPGDYLLLTDDPINLSQHYFIRDERCIIKLALPSFPDDEGSIVLLNAGGGIVDEVNYTEDWHFPLLAGREGVALERIDPARPSNEAGNWHSASSTAGFGTPGYRNSQFREAQPIDAIIDVIPRVFSPDADGFDDIAAIHYRMTAPGFVANITVFDARGTVVRSLVRNALLSQEGYWNWNGLNDRGVRLPAGIYIVYTEIFNLQGKRAQFKNAVVLAQRQ